MKEVELSMRLRNDVQRFVISSPARFSGGYKSDDIDISKMFDGNNVDLFNNRQGFYVVSIRKSDIRGDNNLIIYPDYTYYSDVICMCISVLYGKAFYNHGFIEENGIFRKPDMGEPQIIDFFNDAYSSKVRKDLEIPLDFELFKKIEPIFRVNNDNLTAFINGARFYWRALRNLEKEPEMAFIDLVSCGEALASKSEYSMERLIEHDEGLCQIMRLLEEKLHDEKDQKKVFGFMKKRFRQIKRKYVLTIMDSLNDYFYSNTECVTDGNVGKIMKKNIEENLKKTYDLRSKYIHEGEFLGNSLQQLTSWKNEVEIIATINQDKLLKDTLTLHGLERVMRYCLLVYIQRKMGIIIDDRLSD